MPKRLLVFALLCAVLGTALSDLNSDFLREVNEIAAAEVSDDRTIIHDKTDARIASARVFKKSVASIPEISKAVDNARAAACGVDYVSVGALTHSAPALDLALDLE